MEWDQYATAWADQHGGYDHRRAPVSVRGWLRLGYHGARALAAARVPLGAVITVGLAAAVAVPLVAGTDRTRVLLAAALVLLSILASTLHEALRELTAQAPGSSVIGEAVAARLGEVAWLTGFWLLGVPGPLVLACGVLTGLYEYVRVQAVSKSGS